MERGIKTENPVGQRGPHDNSNRLVEQRVDHLLRLNAKIAHRKSLFANDEEKRRAMLMTRPIDSGRAFGYFGLMIGSLPPLALFEKLSLLPHAQPDAILL